MVAANDARDVRPAFSVDLRSILRLGGSHAEYTIAQLKGFAGEARVAHDNNAGGKLMTAFAGKLSEAEMKAVAEYANDS
jgi:cytochrome c553